MNLKSIRNIIGIILPDLEIKGEPLNTANGAQRFRLFDLNKFRKAVYSLEDLSLFDTILNRIHSSSIFSNSREQNDIDASEYSTVINSLNVLRQSASALHETLNSLLPTEQSEIISIKLPTINNFHKLSEVTEKLDKIFSLTLYNEEIQGEAEILSIYPGSTWIDVNLKKPAAVLLIAGLAWSGAVVHKKYQEGKMLEQQARSLEIRNESMQDIQDAQKRALDLLIESESQTLYNEHFKNNDPEQKERIKLSVKLFSELINEGTEIYPALVAPEQVSNLFPNYSQIGLIESKQKKITQ